MNTTAASPDLVFLDWPAPANVRACTTLREPGVSKPPYDTFNLALHVGDNQRAVTANRHTLSSALKQTNIHWLTQTHSTTVIEASAATLGVVPQADASFTKESQQVCCVMTADCLPVFFCNNDGSQVAIAHAGWRGLCNGILQKTLDSFADSESIMAYLGPAISQAAFEVGDDVREAFLSQENGGLMMAPYFLPADNKGKWMADLYGIAKAILRYQGVKNVYGGDCCTFLESDHYFSYRRDGVTGRMAHLIWLE